MIEFFNSLDPLLRTFWYVAIPASLIFVVQTILTFVGADATDGIEADFEGDLGEVDAPFQLFSFRNLINFLIGFSWTGISFYQTISSKSLLIGFAVLIGCIFVYLFLVLIRQIQKLAEDNSFKISNTINQSAEVYLPIPDNKSGKGKIMISVKGAFHELEAMTEGERLSVGTVVKVVRIENNNILIVEPI
jgi:membrane protein implicated in regulation of membrane protease activity